MKQLLILMLWFFFAFPVYAESMTVDADRFEVFQLKQRADFFGHVVVKRHDTKITADKMSVWYKKEGEKTVLTVVKAWGHVVMKSAENTGIAEQATYVAVSEILTLRGKARMESEQGVLQGEHIEYNLMTKTTQVLKGSEDKQVRFTFGESTK